MAEQGSLARRELHGCGAIRRRAKTFSTAAVLQAVREAHPRDPALWRFTRRSVPRGVALGLFVGIFVVIPGLQIFGAALLATPFGPISRSPPQ